MNGYEKLIKKKLSQNGWSLIRKGKGSHEIWGNGNTSVTVNHLCKSRHTANAIMKQANIDHTF